MITVQQRANLRTLAEFLPTVPQDQFDMDDYRSGPGVDFNESFPAVPECGTVACAAGWAPAALGATGHITNMDNWTQLHLTNYDAPLWEWCFSECWHQIDNTPIGAAKRILHFLDHGLPSDWLEQIDEVAPYMFADQVAA